MRYSTVDEPTQTGIADTRRRPSSYSSTDSISQASHSKTIQTPPSNSKKVLFAFPALQPTNNQPFLSDQPNNAFFEKNSKLASLFFSDDYLDHHRNRNLQ